MVFIGDSILNANTINYIPLQSGGYSVQITDGLGCSSISAEMNVVITNVEYHSNPFKNIQPNPFKESTTILFGENVKGEYELLIYDIVVKEVFRLNNITENKVVINKEDIDKGLFLIYLFNTKN